MAFVRRSEAEHQFCKHVRHARSPIPAVPSVSTTQARPVPKPEAGPQAAPPHDVFILRTTELTNRFFYKRALFAWQQWVWDACCLAGTCVQLLLSCVLPWNIPSPHTQRCKPPLQAAPCANCHVVTQDNLVEFQGL